MNYTLHQLRIFLKVVETGSITEAAARLNLTQPAVSIQLKNFQAQFDIPVFEVVRKKIFITDFGKEIAEAAQSILSQVYAINYRMHLHQGHLIGRLKFSIASTGIYIAPHFITGFIQQHPGVDLQIDVTNKTQVEQSLQRNDVDFALVSILPRHLNLAFMSLLPNKLHLIAKANLDDKKPEGLDALLQKVPFIYREPGSATRELMEQYIKRFNLPVYKKMELTSNEAVKQAVMAGLGCSIMPLIGIKNELQNRQLQIIEARGLPIQTTWYLAWLKERKFSPLAKAYLQFVKEERDQIIQRVFAS